MINNLWLKPYKTGSASARALARALSAKRIRHDNSRYRYRSRHTVINWGCSQHLPYPVVNTPSSVRCASDKVAAFFHMQAAGVSIPEYTTDRAIASQWSGKVVCRTLTRANSGRGIVIANSPNEIVSAPLYTRYVKKRDEYRVHVFDGQVIDCQRKARRQETPDEDVNWQVRSYSNGFVFARENVQCTERMKQLALDAVWSVGLVFGAVDMIYNERQDQYYVLEINTAPGLQGSTLTNYVNAINSYINS